MNDWLSNICPKSHTSVVDAANSGKSIKAILLIEMVFFIFNTLYRLYWL